MQEDFFENARVWAVDSAADWPWNPAVWLDHARARGHALCEVNIKDRTTHNNFIEKIFYFSHIDKVLLYEQDTRALRIYGAKTMRLLKDIHCVGVILAVEYCQNMNSIAVSLSDRTIIFFDTATIMNQKNKIDRRLHVP